MLLRTPTRRYLTTSLRSFTSVFSKKQSEKLPIHREFDCTIDLVPNAAPHHGKIYQLTREEDKVMQDWIAENLAKGFIRNKHHQGSESDSLSYQKCSGLSPSGKVFTTWTYAEPYNLLRIKEGDEPKTAFITKYGQFEFLVMPFGLANAPAQFQRMMNTLFRDSIGKFVLVYLDDIVIYSENLEKHKEHVKSVLTILRANGLYCKLEKCHFYQQEISYLGYVISPNGICMDSAKVKALQDWPTPRKLARYPSAFGVCQFLSDSHSELFQYDLPLDEASKERRTSSPGVLIKKSQSTI
ncbi:hypothetical protein BASA81_017394 [Batrachochytrium salamandrivorans]|nr:hypothetical protein BASA81_017394 [Batrachochytrium salamandrivorans]